ncbi:laccase [Mycena alexandri]|uniref:laccase n=1 Tax=Mycena alexandri TaxID=1745969 RepID=A0AAD6SQK4_9AGAR|nr:laccase [Mycena alexandri]KAJ7031815.1 laccase [Mycena alexandri]
MHLSPSILTLALSLLSGSLGASIGPVGNLPIVNKQIAPDGFSRSTVLAGGTFPGPLIKANKGDRFSLNVEDQLTDPTMLRSTSIHWHGLFQRNTSWADGPSFVTQCPIAANHSFLYDFQAPGQAGTYWYHSHLSTQYCDGLRGPLVIYDPQDPQKHLYDVDSDSTVITLADWYHFTAPSAPAIPMANSTLINGLGRYQGGPTSALAVISVIKGLRYRFRLVAISCDPNFVFSIDGHSMTIIEVDGVNHQPLTVDSLQIFAGQRYSVVVNANQKVGNYWVRANPNIGLATGFAGGINSAILRYVGAPNAEPTTSSTGTTPLVETALHPLVPSPVPGKPVPGGADINLNLVITLNTTDFRFNVNGFSFIPPTAPVLLQVLSGAQAAQDLLPAGSVYTLPPNKVIEISIPGGSPGAPHPFHLHGHNFHVVRSAGNSSYNFANPVIRDVVSTGPATTDNTTFRFVTDNAGPWFLHCHIDWHLEIGLAIVFAEDTGTLKKEQVPAAWDKLCPIYDALKPNQL